MGASAGPAYLVGAAGRPTLLTLLSACASERATALQQG